jgi:hypothetical protein
MILIIAGDLNNWYKSVWHLPPAAPLCPRGRDLSSGFCRRCFDEPREGLARDGYLPFLRFCRLSAPHRQPGQ